MTREQVYGVHKLPKIFAQGQVGGRVLHLQSAESLAGMASEFLIFLIVSGLLAIFFLLYFNRLFASIVSYAIRSYTWRTYRVYIDVKAIQISLLAGRIFFTGLRYHGPNETFSIQHGDITWRYWLRRVREADVFIPNTQEEVSASEKEKNSALPCRIHVKVVGIEWFVYNRGAAYDSVLAGLAENETRASTSSDVLGASDNSRLRSRKSQQREIPDGGDAWSQKAEDTESEEQALPPQASTSNRSSIISTSITTADDVATNSLPSILRLLPIHIECQKTGLVVGNDNTKAILIVKANSASAIVDASQTKTCDPYRQLFRIQFDHPVVEMRENDEFREDQTSRATRQHKDAMRHSPLPHRSFFRLYRRKLLHSLRNMVPHWRRSVQSFSTDSRGVPDTGVSQIPGSGHWQGLSRYLDDKYQDDKARWSSIEYAAVTTILDSPSAAFTIYWDAVTKVTDAARRQSSSSFHTSINGSEPPAWGMTLSVKGGTMSYGPWADRMRADLQRVFYPTLSKDAVASEPLPSGSWRAPSQFQLHIDLEDAMTLRVPIREESKNWRWRGKEPPIGQQTTGARKRRHRNKKSNKRDAQPIRPSGWLEIKVPSNSTISYSMDMFARPTGYCNQLNIDLPSTELRSSVNHDLLWTSGPQSIKCDLSTPLGWNTMRTWYFNVVCSDMKLYLLRDHIYLLTDLVDDWASGPPSEYLVFTPFIYRLNLDLHNLRLFLNVNDENIVDKATALDDNCFLIISSPLLKAETSIPLDKFRPSKNAIPFDINAETFDLCLHASQSDTQAAFLSSNELGHGNELSVTGSYQYNATTAPANTDTLILNIHIDSPYLYLYGFIVRYCLILKDNYFGEHVHFRTLDEYQEQIQRHPLTEPILRPPLKKSNDLDIMLSITIDGPRVFVPTNLYSADRYLQCELADLSIDVRFTNYYMDMELLLSPLSLSLGSSILPPKSTNSSYSNTQLFLDGVRVFGHRAFGLPPSEPTYLCNWDVSIGMIEGECTTDFVSALAKGATAFGFTFDDVENALVPYSSLLFHDVTFVRLDVASVHLWLHVNDAAFLLSTGAIQVRSNDWAGAHYSKRANVNIPRIELSCINAESAARHTSRRHHPVETMAYLKTEVNLATIGRKFHFREELETQQALLRREDQRTERTPFLLRDGVEYDFLPEPVDPPAQSVPLLAYPVSNADADDQEPSRTSETAHFTNHLQRRSSFWSLSSSSNASFHLSPSHSRSRRRSRQTLAMSGGSISIEKEKHVLGRKKGALPSELKITSNSQSDRAQRHDEPNEHSSVAFSSQYFSPHFPLKSVRPDGREATFDDAIVDDEDKFMASSSSLEDINPDCLSDNHAQTSTIIEFPTGITAFFNPEAVRQVNALLAALQPSETEDILDALQVHSIDQIFSDKKEKNITGFVQELSIKLPKANIRFLNSITAQSWNSVPAALDQYDLRIVQTMLNTRTVKDRAGDHSTSRTSVHFRLRSAELSASERLSSKEPPQAAVMVNINNVRLSLGEKDITYLDAEIGSIVGSTASGKVEYLASVIHRTSSIASELADLLSETSSHQEKRIQYLICKLLEESEATNDPPFLTRPSAVLRSAHEHMRTVDSWKLMMRLRQIWSTLNHNKREHILEECQNESLRLSHDVVESVVTAFQKWRSWDLDDPSNSVLLKYVFGNMLARNRPDPQEYPILASCRLSELQFVLDPGPKQNNIALLDLTMGLDKRLAGLGQGLPELKDFHGPLTIVNLCCGEVMIRLNWELCELVEDILRLYNKARPPPPPPPKIENVHESTKEAISSPGACHVVFEVVKVSLEAETINLTAKTIIDEVKASIVLCNTGTELNMANAILNCKLITSEMQSHGQMISILQLQEPSVFGAYEIQEPSHTTAHIIKASASSQDLSFKIKQDPVSLFEVLDLLIMDEAARLYKLKNRFPSKVEEDKESDQVKKRMCTFVVNVATFLDGYTIRVPLVQSLTYTISGSVARASCAADFGKEIIFDFDIKENSHEMQINVDHEPRSISLLQIPPANGRITSDAQSTGNVVNILASVEVIRFDASAIYSLLSALNRPQISGAIDEVQQQIKIIQTHMTEIFGTNTAQGPSTKPTSHGEPTHMAYDCHLALAGIRILAKTSLKSANEPMAQILFALDKVTLQASNQPDTDVTPLRYPDLHINLRQISLDICRGRPDALRSCGSLSTGINISASSRLSDNGKEDWSLHFCNDNLVMKLSPETVSTVIDVIGYMGSRIRDLDTSLELEYLRKLRQTKPKIKINDDEDEGNWSEDADLLESVLSSITYKFELRNMSFSWEVADESAGEDSAKEDLILSIDLIEFGTRTRKSARLTIENFLLQTVPPGRDRSVRSLHSALLPEVIFNVAYASTPVARRMAFQAVGDSLDLRLTSGFIVPAANLVKSISLSMKNVQTASAQWTTKDATTNETTGHAQKKPENTAFTPTQQRHMFGRKRLESLLVDADFAGAVVYVSTRKNSTSAAAESKYSQPSLAGKYGQFSVDDSGSGAVLRTPGLAWKAEYCDNGIENPSLDGEIKINASSNILYPSVVPLVLDIISSVKNVVRDDDELDRQPKRSKHSEGQPDQPGRSERPERPERPDEPDEPRFKLTRSADEDNFLTSDPSTVLGRLRLNLGLRILKQEFSLSCQPIARVSATTYFDNVYFTLNTVTSQEQGNFFAISGVITKPQASVQHVYSRDSTASFELDSVSISFMNSKHFSGTSGVSAILNVSPMKVSVNAKQVQDFLLFREIWYPEELRQKPPVQAPKMPTDIPQAHLVQRYQEVAATAAFPWTATIFIAALDVSIDLGQAIGKSIFHINDFWISSKKTSDWEQNLCLGFKKVGIDCTGRLSGFVALQDFRLQTSIHWPRREEALNESPLVQASLAFNALRVKAAFDYQAFLVADVTSLEFLMYNVREHKQGSGDRLVAILDGEAVQVFLTTTSVAQSVALYQAVQKLIQERRENFESSLREIEKFMKRGSFTLRGALPQHFPVVPKMSADHAAAATNGDDDALSQSPISLDTDVVVSLKALNLGVFPSTFSDHQVFKVEALNAFARFSASMEQQRVHSILRMVLGQLRIGLAGVRDAEAPKTMNEMTVEEVVQRSTGSRGGTILKVPRVEAVMETWQKPASNHIEYKFKSAFEGKVEVGWNYSRISYIRGMWASHSKSLEQVWGRQLPMTAVKITGVPDAEGEQQKITAEVNVPLSKYDYVALEPPVIETPQLRDMGEATPPLEWIGLHRERLPNLTHQIVIVSLLELAGEVEDAYSRILG
ncbi:hypothetical protein E4U43_005623 [Claviceps pusilla]|uniref:CSF1 protein n=1 Tax=Claviceps pusilla TaxID=123648 RepID=A0A9P7NGR3_9HYPO|nr:hypothetical protein E4U43_005623 [Claviceps pusilla]